MTRVLLLSNTTGYQVRAFDEAAAALGVELVFATDRCHKLDDPWQDRAIPVRFYDLEASLSAILLQAETRPIDGVIAVGDRSVVLAARAAHELGIPWHSVAGAMASADKRRSRAIMAAAGLPSPRFGMIRASERDIHAGDIGFPCVIKPVGLSGSRGVIRANNPRECAGAIWRIRALLARPQIRAARAGLEDELLVEEFIGGREFALEGLMTEGALSTLAIFDKPDPLDGPFFEETIYVTPSRANEQIQREISASVAEAAWALDLRHGSIHAECRVNEKGVYVLEVAARPIGGLCSRVLTFVPAQDAAKPPKLASLEHLLLEHAVGESPARWIRERRAAAVMMIPIPRRGRLKSIRGEEDARVVPGIVDLRITAKLDQLLEPLPEAGSYLGFIFARGETPEDAERAVREAHDALSIEIDREVALRQA